MNTIKVGVIGAGAIAPSHCKGVAKHPKAEVVAIADAHEGRVKAAAEELGIPKTYTDVKAIVGDPDIDAISIALPTYLHAPMAIAALEAGKHVLLDKPFAMNQAEAVKVIETAAAANKIFAVGMNQRFTEEAQTIRALIRRGEVGDAYAARTFWCRRSGAPISGPNVAGIVCQRSSRSAPVPESLAWISHREGEYYGGAGPERTV